MTIESFFTEQCLYLSDNNFDVTVVCSECKNIKKIFGDKVKCKEIYIARGIDPFSIGKSIRELKNFFIEEQFDMVQYSTPNAAFVASIAAKKANIPIRNYHLMGFRYLGASGVMKTLLKTLEKITCRNSTDIECVSPSNMELGTKDNIFKKDKAAIVWNGSTGGVNLKRFDVAKRSEWRKYIRESLGYDENDYIFGFVGRITRDKGINELLSAFLKLQKGKLLLIGNPEGINTLDQDLYKCAQQSSNVKFVNAVNDIEKYYAAIDVLVLPSYREGFGMVVAEAGAMGAPAIVSNIPGPTDVCVNNVTGIYVERKNPDDLCAAMNKMFENKEMTKQFANAAVNYITTHFDSAKLNEYILKRKKDLLNCGEN